MNALDCTSKLVLRHQKYCDGIQAKTRAFLSWLRLCLLKIIKLVLIEPQCFNKRPLFQSWLFTNKVLCLASTQEFFLILTETIESLMKSRCWRDNLTTLAVQGKYSHTKKMNIKVNKKLNKKESAAPFSRLRLRVRKPLNVRLLQKQTQVKRTTLYLSNSTIHNSEAHSNLEFPICFCSTRFWRTYVN